MALERHPQPRIGSVPALVAAFITVAVAGLYVTIIASQGDFGDEPGLVIFVTLYLVVTAAFAFSSSVARDPAMRVIRLGAATGGLFAIGILAAFSVGLPLIAAGAMSAFAWVRTSDPAIPKKARRLAAVLALSAPVVLVAGIALA